MAELPEKATDFIDWYLAAVETAGLSDKRYPVKGMNVWTPYGFLARRNLDAVLVRAIEATGSVPVEFPALIPKTEFQKEADHIKGFDANVFWVTRGGATELDVPLVLRPTSETAMYPVFALWVRSHQDLPLQVYQIVNTFRYETRTTRPFLRVREIHFFEEHSCQRDEASATGRVESNLAAFQEIADSLAIPYLVSRRPEWDKFPGAYYSVAFDIPVGGAHTLQLGTVHHYRENFSRPYGIQYEDADGSRKYVHQTTFGLSERLLGAVVAVHGDGKGVVFPSSIAPFSVVIVPIPGADGDRAAWDAGRTLANRLQRRGLKIKLDDSDERPGAKYYRWEAAGVPVRLEIGPREVENGTVTAVDRLGEKRVLGPNDLEGSVESTVHAFDGRLYERAREAFRKSFAVARTLEELRGSAQVRLLSWCGKEACGHAIEAAIDGGLLGTLERPPPIEAGPPGPCVVCGEPSLDRWSVAAQPL